MTETVYDWLSEDYNLFEKSTFMCLFLIVCVFKKKKKEEEEAYYRSFLRCVTNFVLITWTEYAPEA